MQTQRTEQGRTVRWLSTLLLFGVILTMALPSAVMADGTPAGGSISNTATISFSAGGGGSIDLASSPVTFYVDRKIDVLVTDGDGSAYIPAAPGATGVVLSYLVTNQSNANVDLVLSTGNHANDPYTAAGDDFQVAFPADNIIPDLNGNGIYEPGVDLPSTTLSDLADETPVRVFVLVNIPAIQTENQTAGVVLYAQATEVGGVALAESPGPTAGPLPDTIFTDDAGYDDAARQADHSAGHAVQVRTGYLTITKGATVIWDPLNLDTNPLAIPDAYVQYTITIAHDGSVPFPANLTALTDILAATLIFDPDLIVAATFTPESGLGLGFKITPPVGRGGGADRFRTTDDADADGAGITGNVITLDFQTILSGDAGYGDGELQANEQVVVTFNAIID